MKALALVLVGFAVLLSACAQETVDSSKIAATKSSPNAVVTDNIDRDYILTQTEGDSRVSFFATFSMSGTWNTTVRLIAPARLVFNGSQLGEEQLISKDTAVLTGLLLPVFSPLLWAASGTHYMGASAGQASYSILFVDQVGSQFYDQMKIYPCVLNSATADGASAYTPGAPGETEYEATLSQDHGNGNSEFASASSSNGSMSFTAEELARFTPGPATLKVECHVRTSLNSSGSGRASGTSVYEFTPRTVMVGH